MLFIYATIVRGEVLTEPLMIALKEEIIKSGGFPIIQPFFSNHSRSNAFSGVSLLEFRDENQISFVPNSAYDLYKETDGFITILGTENPNTFKNYLNGLVKLKKSISKLDDIRTEESIYTLTKFSTKSEAFFEDINYTEYVNFIINSSIVDYVSMEQEQLELVDFLTQ